MYTMLCSEEETGTGFTCIIPTHKVKVFILPHKDVCNGHELMDHVFISILSGSFEGVSRLAKQCSPCI